MGSVLPWLSDLLVSGGLWILFAVCVLETAFFVGLLIPSGPIIVLAAFLATQGVYPAGQVVAVVMVGGVVGDQIGYLLGRHARDRFRPLSGRVGKAWRTSERRMSRLFVQHAMISISMGRTISFVRTLIPWFAGRSRIRYGRFLLYDLLGIVAWGGFFLASGFLAGEGWEHARKWLGPGGAAAVGVAVVLILSVVLAVRRRRRSAGRRGV